MSDPDLQHAREALAKLEHLVVQDIFLTETACHRRRGAAGLGLPGEDGHLHQHRPPGAARPPGPDAARRGAPGLVRSSRSSPAASASTGPTASRARSSTRWRRSCRRWGTSPGSGWSARGPSPIPATARTSPGRSHLRRRLPDAARAAASSCRPTWSARRAARRRVPDGPDHRPAARALAHRRDDPAGQRARRARARGGGASSRPASSSRRASRPATRPGRRPGAARSSWPPAPTATCPPAWSSSPSASPRPPPTS